MALDGLKALNNRCNTLMVGISACALVAMAFMTTLDVGLRYVFNAPLPASVEISQLIEPWVIFLPFAYTLAMNRHVRVGLLTIRLPRVWRLASDLFSLLVAFALFSCMTWYSWQDFYASYEINEIMMAAIILPWWVGKAAMPLGMVLTAVQCVMSALFTVDAFRNPVPNASIQLPAL